VEYHGQSQRRCRWWWGGQPVLAELQHCQVPLCVRALDEEDSGVLREQMAHLLVVAEWPNIDLRVVPFEVGAYGTMNGSCLIVDYPEPDAMSGVYLEYPAGGAWVDNRDDVQRFTSMFDDVVDLALSPADTTNLIHEHMKRLSNASPNL
jgi:hypothetical protein